MIKEWMIENKGAEISMAYRINEMLALNANYSYLDMKYAVLAAPEHKLFAGLDFTKGRWSIATSVQYVKGLYTSVAANNTTTENYALWNLRGAFKVSKQVEIFVKGENLLDSEYEINQGFTMPGASVMGGVNICF